MLFATVTLEDAIFQSNTLNVSQIFSFVLYTAEADLFYTIIILKIMHFPSCILRIFHLFKALYFQIKKYTQFFTDNNHFVICNFKSVLFQFY